MVDAVKRRLMRWFRIPPDPEPPAGSAASVRVFRAAKNYYRYALTRWGLRQLGVVIGIIAFLTFTAAVPDRLTLDEEDADELVRELPAPLLKLFRFLGLIEEAPPVEGEQGERTALSYRPIVLWLEVVGIGFFLLQLPLSYAMVRLDYELRWYIVTDRSLRIREGVWSIRETTMTFANIQNVAIEQGPIQRLIGIADLKVRTAGGGSGGEETSGQHGQREKDSMHVGYFRGVDNAPELRDRILAQLKTLKDAGLGDGSEEADVVSAGGELDAARRVLEEARALRAALGESRG